MQKDFLKAYEEHSDALFRHCFFKVHDREIAKDILQESFTKVWDYIAKGGKITNMRAFLYKTLNNLVIDYYRKKPTTSLDDMADEGFDPKFEESSKVEDVLDGQRALGLLQKLPSLYRDAIFMRFVNGLELSEIAVITGETENVVAVHVHRGLNKLRELFEYGQ